MILGMGPSRDHEIPEHEDRPDHHRNYRQLHDAEPAPAAEARAIFFTGWHGSSSFGSSGRIARCIANAPLPPDIHPIDHDHSVLQVASLKLSPAISSIMPRFSTNSP